MKKIFTLFLLFNICLFGTLHAASRSGGDKIYLDASLWAGSNVWIQVWTGTTAQKLYMSAVEGESNLFEVILPTGTWNNILFVRTSSESSCNGNFDFSGDCFLNQTVDLSFEDGKNLFVVNSWGGGFGAKNEGYWGDYEAYYQTINSGTWSGTTTWQKASSLRGPTNWVAVSQPPTSDIKKITIIDGHSVQLDNNITINNIEIQNNASVICNNYDVNFLNGATITNNGTFNTTTNTIEFAGTGTISGTNPITFNNLFINSELILNTAPFIADTLKLKPGSFISSGANISPNYLEGSVLKYANNTTYHRGLEWTLNENYPCCVYLTSNTSLNIGANGATGTTFECKGNLIIEEGSTFTMNSPGDQMEAPMIVYGNIINDGTIILSNKLKGDLKVEGDFENNGTIQFNYRALFLQGNKKQTIKSSSALSFPYFFNEKNGGIIAFGGNITIQNGLAVDTMYIENGSLSIGKNLSLSSKGLLVNQAGASLAVADTLIMSKTNVETSQIQNDGTINVGEALLTKISFPNPGNWHFIGMPHDASIFKMENGSLTSPVKGTDYVLRLFDAGARASSGSGWINPASDPTYTANNGYALASMQDLYVEAIPQSDFFASQKTNDSFTFVNGNEEIDKGWNFKINPLSTKATIDLTTVGEFLYVYNSENDTYITKDNEDAQEVELQPFEAFFVKTVAERNDVTFSRVNAVTRSKNLANTNDNIKLALMADTYNYTTRVKINPNATTAYDVLYDAPHTMAMAASTPQLYTLAAGSKLAINSVPGSTTVPVGLRVSKAGEYTLAWDGVLNNESATLYDKLTETTTDLSVNSSYTFVTDKTGEINDRFVLNFTTKNTTDDITPDKDVATVINTLPGKVVINNLPENSLVKLYDISGKCLSEITASGTTEIAVPSRGIYIIDVNSIKSKIICQ